MFFCQFAPSSDHHAKKLKLIIKNDIYFVKLSICIDNSEVISNCLKDLNDKTELTLDISNENHQFKAIAKLFNGKRIYLNTFNIDYIEYAAQKLKINGLFDEIMKYRKYLSESENENLLSKLCEIESLLFDLNPQNFDHAISSELFNNLSQEEISFISKYFYHALVSDVQKAPILFNFLSKLNSNNNYYTELFIDHISKIDSETKIYSFIVYNLFMEDLIKKEDIKKLKSDFFLPNYDHPINLEKLFQNIKDQVSNENMIETIENIRKGLNTSELATTIRNDDVDTLQQLSSVENFDFNQIIPSCFYECSSLLSISNLIQYAAAFRSVKCFKFLLINGAEINSKLVEFAILGGSPEILRICEQHKCNFDSSLLNSISYHQDIIFDWLIDMKFRVESSTDTCTYAFHGKDYFHQQWFNCPQCQLVGPFGLCYACSKKCHKCHKGMKYKKMTNAFCDCGDSGYCCCLPDNDSDSCEEEEEKGDEKKEESNENSNAYSDDDANNNKYEKKNFYNMLAKFLAVDDENDEDYKNDDVEYNNGSNANSNDDNNNANIIDDNDNSNINDEHDNNNNNNNDFKTMRKKKIFKFTGKKYASSGELVIECYKNMNFICLQKLINMGVNIVKSLDPPLLVEAVKNNDILFAKYLLKFSEIDINNADTARIYKNPLLIACDNGYTDIFNILIKHPNIDVNISDCFGFSPLHKAILKNNTYMVEELLKFPNICVNFNKKYQATPIFLSCVNGNYDIFELLFNRKDIEIDFVRKESFGRYNENIFLAACRSGSEKIVKKLFEAQLHLEEKSQNESNINSKLDNLNQTKNIEETDINIKKNTIIESNNNENTTNNDENNVNDIMNDKPDSTDDHKFLFIDSNNKEHLINFQKNKKLFDMIISTDGRGKNALHLACNSGNIDLIKFIISTHLFDINESGGLDTPLRCVCMSGNLEAFKFIVKQEGIDLSKYSRFKLTPLHYSCSSNWPELTDYILENKLYDINSVDKYNKSPIFYACESLDKSAILRLLKEADINVNLSDNEGNTPLHIAAIYGSKEITEVLLADQRVERNPRNKHLQTPLHCSIINGYEIECYKVLINDDKIDIHAKDDRNGSILYYAAGFCFEAVDLIVDKCLDQINDKTIDEMTPLHNACLQDEIDIVKRFLQIPGIKVNEENAHGDTPYTLTSDQQIKDLISNYMKENDI